jgi:protein TonB
MGFTGKVFVRFDVEKNGHVDSVVVVRGAHPLLNAEAVRVISAMPDWSPGRQGGKPVRKRYTLPISFTMPQKDLDRIRKKQAKRAAKQER